MKSFLLSMLAIVLIVSCRYDMKQNCATTMAAIAGRYHITKLEQVAFTTGVAQNITSTLTTCQLSDVYSFYIDSTATYTPLPGCGTNESGRWSVDNGYVSISFDPGNAHILSLTAFVSWDCSKLVMITLYPNAVSNNRYTLTKF